MFKFYKIYSTIIVLGTSLSGIIDGNVFIQNI